MSHKMLERGKSGISEMENKHHMQNSSWVLGFFYHHCDWIVSPVSGYEFVSGFFINSPCVIFILLMLDYLHSLAYRILESDGVEPQKFSRPIISS